MKKIVISAVNVRKGGTLTILKECLSFLSHFNTDNRFKIYALVHDEKLCHYPNIEYINIPWSIKGWLRRLWCEYVTMHKISKEIGDIDIWFSLHDTSPRVIAKKQAVYLQTSFPFYEPNIDDLKFDIKIVIFSYLLKGIYKINSSKNTYFIVQQEWLRQKFAQALKQPIQKFIVSPPSNKTQPQTTNIKSDIYTFVFPSTGDVHKNFQFLCRATEVVENRLGENAFRVLMTISGEENRYTKWLKQKWGHIKSLEFIGLQPKDKLWEIYGKSDCLVFPSKIETWGLPISEFMPTGKYMLLADKPYAHETSMGGEHVAFFSLDDVNGLASKMEMLIKGDDSILSKNERVEYKEPLANGWNEIFNYLINE